MLVELVWQQGLLEEGRAEQGRTVQGRPRKEVQKTVVGSGPKSVYMVGGQDLHVQPGSLANITCVVSAAKLKFMEQCRHLLAK